MKAEISAFLKVVEPDETAETDNIGSLARALDDLVLAYERSVETEDVVEYDAPASHYEAFYAAASQAFPSLGYYPIVDVLKSTDQEVLLADAADDIADIANELNEVLWRLDNTSPDDANWYFRFTYETHWGVHLHNLRVYLHAKLYRLGGATYPSPKTLRVLDPPSRGG